MNTFCFLCGEVTAMTRDSAPLHNAYNDSLRAQPLGQAGSYRAFYKKNKLAPPPGGGSIEKYSYLVGQVKKVPLALD